MFEVCRSVLPFLGLQISYILHADNEFIKLLNEMLDMKQKIKTVLCRPLSLFDNQEHQRLILIKSFNETRQDIFIIQQYILDITIMGKCMGIQKEPGKPGKPRPTSPTSTYSQKPKKPTPSGRDITPPIILPQLDYKIFDIYQKERLSQQLKNQFGIFYSQNLQLSFTETLSYGQSPSKSLNNQNACQLSVKIVQSRPVQQNQKNQLADFNGEKRKRVKKTLDNPYSCIGHLTFRDHKNDIFYGTAFLVGNNTIMTAAHNIYDRSTKKTFIQFSFSPGCNGPVGRSCRISKYWCPKQYQQFSQQDCIRYDYAVLQLQQKIGQTYGYFGLDFRGKVENTQQVTIAGYPLHYIGDVKNEMGEISKGKILAKKTMYQDFGNYYSFPKKDKFNEGRIRYLISTSSGQSGSPIFRKQGDNFFVIGIHTQGGEKYNSGILINKEKQDVLKLWSKKVLGRKLTLHNKSIYQLNELFKHKLVQQINEFDFDRNQICDQGAKCLAQIQLVNPLILNLNNNGITSLGAYYLSSIKPVVKLNLENLDYRRNKELNCIKDQGVRTLSQGHLTKLEDLNLRKNKISGIGCVFLGESNLQNLKILNLARNNIGENIQYSKLKGFEISGKQTIIKLTKNKQKVLQNLGLSSLAKLKSLTHLILQGNKLTPPIIPPLKQLPNLTHLDISNNPLKAGTFNQIGDEGAKELASGGFINLEQINLQNTQLGPQGAKQLANGNLKKLKLINLSSNKLGPSGAKYLATGNLKNLQNINMFGNNISCKGAKYLSRGNFQRLKILNLHRNSIGDLGATYLGSGNLKNLETLDLSYNKITDEGAERIAKGNFNQLKTLKLYDNKIGYQGVKHLSNGNLKNVIELDLGSNEIGPFGAFYLADNNMQKLQNLQLNMCKIKQNGAKNLSKGKFNKLVVLSLYSNQIGDVGVNFLAHGKLANLSHIDLEENGLTDQGIRSIIKGNLKNLKSINIDNNESVSKEMAEYLIQYIRCLSTGQKKPPGPQPKTGDDSSGFGGTRKVEIKYSHQEMMMCM